MDFSSTSSVDPAAIRALKALSKIYLKKDIQTIFTGCAPSLIQVMDRCDFLQDVGIEHFFPTVSDAVRFCCVPNFDQLDLGSSMNNNSNIKVCPESHINVDCLTNIPFHDPIIDSSIFEKIPNNV